MIIIKEKKFIEKEDLIAFEEYAKNRKKIRKDLVEFKKNRRVSIGPYATFYFESFETMLAQVQEMLHIEKGGDEQLKDELNAYNPLIPKGKELVATLMFEIDDPMLRVDFLSKIGGIEEKIYMRVNKETIKAVSEIGVSITRSAPNLSNNPPVAPKIPPYLATSSPITKTFSSLSISCAIPSEIAAAIVNSRLFSFPIIFSYLCNYTKTC